MGQCVCVGGVYSSSILTNIADIRISGMHDMATPNTKMSSAENSTLIMQLDMLATISISCCLHKMLMWCGLGIETIPLI